MGSQNGYRDDTWGGKVVMGVGEALSTSNFSFEEMFKGTLLRCFKVKRTASVKVFFVINGDNNRTEGHV